MSSTSVLLCPLLLISVAQARFEFWLILIVGLKCSIKKTIGLDPKWVTAGQSTSPHCSSGQENVSTVQHLCMHWKSQEPSLLFSLLPFQRDIEFPVWCDGPDSVHFLELVSWVESCRQCHFGSRPWQNTDWLFVSLCSIAASENTQDDTSLTTVVKICETSTNRSALKSSLMKRTMVLLVVFDVILFGTHPVRCCHSVCNAPVVLCYDTAFLWLTGYCKSQLQRRVSHVRSSASSTLNVSFNSHF